MCKIFSDQVFRLAGFIFSLIKKMILFIKGCRFAYLSTEHTTEENTKKLCKYSF